MMARICALVFLCVSARGAEFWHTCPECKKEIKSTPDLSTPLSVTNTPAGVLVTTLYVFKCAECGSLTAASNAEFVPVVHVMKVPVPATNSIQLPTRAPVRLQISRQMAATTNPPGLRVYPGGRIFGTKHKYPPAPPGFYNSTTRLQPLPEPGDE